MNYQTQNKKHKFDLEGRTLAFARNVRDMVNKLPKTIVNREYCKQLIRSSSSIGANYIEANEALGKKDFKMRLRIARKEAKETIYWLNLITTPNNTTAVRKLAVEATELLKILSAILEKAQ